MPKIKGRTSAEGVEVQDIAEDSLCGPKREEVILDWRKLHGDDLRNF